MRILIAAIGHHTATPSGSSRVAWDEAQAFAEGGHEVWVLAPANSPGPFHETVRGVHLLRFWPREHSSWSLGRVRAHSDAAQDVLHEYLPTVDLIHGHVPLTTAAAIEFYGPNVPLAYTLHSPSRMEMAVQWRNVSLGKRLMAPAALALINRLEKKCLSRASVITALSKYTVRAAEQCHGRAIAERIQVMPGWVDSNRFVPLHDLIQARRALGWSPDLPVFFTLRRLVPRMGLDQLLHAAAEVRRGGDRFQLVIGGAGPLANMLAELTRKLQLESTVQFMGRIADEMLPLAYGACDAFVLPTAELECFGLIALEALSAGRPVLATPVGAIPEVLEPIEPRWLAKSAGAHDIAALIRDFLRNQLPSRAPEYLHSYVASKYSQAILLPKLLSYVGSVDHEAQACNAD